MQPLLSQKPYDIPCLNNKSNALRNADGNEKASPSGEAFCAVFDE